MTAEAAHDASDERLSFTHGVRRSVAVDSRILLRAPDGRFVALSPALRPLVDRLEGGCDRRELRQLIECDARDAEGALRDFIESLRRAGVLGGRSREPSRRERLMAHAGADFLLRLPIRADPDRIAQRLAQPLHGVRPSRLLVVALVLGTAGVALGLATVQPWQPRLHPVGLLWLLLIAGVVLAQLALHELCHAVALRAQDVPVREAGVGLLYFFVPVAYVDRTEAYAVRSRPGLVLIALAGVLFDASMIGAASVAASFASGVLHDALAIYVTAELFLLAANCNPLFRSDGYHALEAAFGALNMRARAFRIVIDGVCRRSQPGYIRAMSRRARVGLAVYAGGSVVYLTVVLAGLCRTILASVLPPS